MSKKIMSKKSINDARLWYGFCKSGRDLKKLETILDTHQVITFKEKNFTNLSMFLLDSELDFRIKMKILKKVSKDEVKFMPAFQHQMIFGAMIEDLVDPMIIGAAIDKGFKPGAISAESDMDSLEFAFAGCAESDSEKTFNRNYEYIILLLGSGEIHDFPDQRGKDEADEIATIFEKNSKPFSQDANSKNDIQRYLTKFDNRQCQPTVTLPKRSGIYPIIESPKQEEEKKKSASPNTKTANSFGNKLMSCFKGKNSRVGP